MFGHSELVFSRIDVSIVDLMIYLVLSPGALPLFNEIVAQATNVSTPLLGFPQFLVQGPTVNFLVTIFSFTGRTPVKPIK